MNNILKNKDKIVLALSFVATLFVCPLVFALLNETINDVEVAFAQYGLQLAAASVLFALAVSKNQNIKLYIIPLVLSFGSILFYESYYAMINFKFNYFYYIAIYGITLCFNIVYILGNTKVKNIAELLLFACACFSLVNVFNSSFYYASMFLTQVSLLMIIYLVKIEEEN